MGWDGVSRPPEPCHARSCIGGLPARGLGFFYGREKCFGNLCVWRKKWLRDEYIGPFDIHFIFSPAKVEFNLIVGAIFGPHGKLAESWRGVSFFLILGAERGFVIRRAGLTWPFLLFSKAMKAVNSLVLCGVQCVS